MVVCFPGFELLEIEMLACCKTQITLLVKSADLQKPWIICLPAGRTMGASGQSKAAELPVIQIELVPALVDGPVATSSNPGPYLPITKPM
jgi:hypothetical protein